MGKRNKNIRFKFPNNDHESHTKPTRFCRTTNHSRRFPRHKKRNTTNRDGTDLPGRSHQRSSNTTSASICCPEPRVPERTASRVWNRPGETQIFNNPSSWAQAARLISPLPLAHTREKMTKLRSMVSILINKSQNQETTYRIIANWLEQAEKELAAHRAVAFERSRDRPDLMNHTSLARRRSRGAFKTPECPCSQSV